MIRLLLLIHLVVLSTVLGMAQSKGPRAKSTTYSASSEWQKVTLKSTPRLATNQGKNTSVSSVEPARPLTADNSTFRPAFTGDFMTNRNGWKAGNRGDYHYEIGNGRYSIRKRKSNTQQVAFSAVALPTDINLNSADIFTIKVDILADSGQVPKGGLVFGVKDSLNYSSFTLNEKGQVSIKCVANGSTSSDYMPGDFFSPGVPVDKNRNRFTIQRQGDQLHFYINAQEINSSPYVFRMLSGNGIGFTASAYWTSFQKLSVTLGL